MRPILLALVALHPLLVASSAAATDGVPIDVAAARALADLQRALQGAGNAEAALADAEAHVFAASRADPEPARAAWRAAAAATSQPVYHALAAEAALLRLAAANVELSMSLAEIEGARTWLRVILVRVPHEARDVPSSVLTEPQTEFPSLRATMHAALALRTREAVMTALLVHRAGDAAAAAEAAAGAQHLVQIVVDHAAPRLRPGLAAPLSQNATRVAEAVREAPTELAAPALTGLLAPLIALEYGRDVEPLDEFALRNVDATFAAARATREDAARAPVLAEAANRQYAADRPRLFSLSETNLTGWDAAQDVFQRRFATGGNVDEAAAQLYAEARKAALLERGLVLKVETGGVQPGRTHTYAIALIRPPLEGITSYAFTLTFDPTVIEILDARAVNATGRLTWWLADGALSVEGEEALIRQSAYIARFDLRAVGPRGATTELRVTHATFQTGDAAADVFRLRHGAVTVAELAPPEDVGGKAPAPGSAAALAALAVLGASLRRRASPYHRPPQTT
jgi:hypothetical protein